MVPSQCYMCGELTHGGDHVSCCTLAIREPESCELGGGKKDEGLAQCTQGLAQHDHSVAQSDAFPCQRFTDAHQCTNGTQPGSQNQLRFGRHMQRNNVATHKNTLTQRYTAAANKVATAHNSSIAVVCTVIRSPRLSIIHVAPKVSGMATTMKTTENQLTSSRLTLRYWDVWVATGAKVSHIWGSHDDI